MVRGQGKEVSCLSGFPKDLIESVLQDSQSQVGSVLHSQSKVGSVGYTNHFFSFDHTVKPL